MIPINSSSLSNSINELKVEIQPSKTYKLYIEKERISSSVDKLNAIEQAIYKTLMTERYKYEIYNWNYGVELRDLIGQHIDYVKAELERRITEALIIDDRIEDVKNFTFKTINKNILVVTFVVKTINGDLEISKEVEI